MKEMSATLGSGIMMRDVAEQWNAAIAASEQIEILASENLPLMNGMNASIHAMRSKDGTVFARLMEWGIYSQGVMRMLVHDEPNDPLPDYHTAPYSIFTKLTPIENHANLKWRDQSRWKLVQQGAFDKKTDTTADNNAGNKAGNGNGGDAPARERVRSRRQDQPSHEKKRQEPSEKQPGDKQRLRILVDRNPENGTSQSTGAGFLRVAGFAVEGAKSFVKLMAWGVMAAKLEADLTRALKAANGAPISLAVEGKFKMLYGKRIFDISEVASVEQTAERIPQRAPQSEQRSAPEQSR